MRRFAMILGIALAAISMAKPATAAWYIYHLNQNPAAGTWQLSLGVSFDNGGIASYRIPIEGEITSLNHQSARAGAAENADGSLSGSVGFTQLRSADGIAEVSKTLTGGQDVVTPTPFIIYGYGQSAGNWNTVAGGPITPLGSNEGNNWLSRPIIASGTMTPGTWVKVAFPADIDVNVFAAVGNLNVVRAVPYPEPASGVMAVAALLAVTASRRHLAARR